MAATLTLSYDSEGDVLHIALSPGGSGVEFDFLGDDIVARYDPKTRAVDHLDVLGFSKRFARVGDLVELPVEATLTLNVDAIPCD